MCLRWSISLGTLSTDTTGELDVLGHDGHSLGVDGAKVGVLEERHEVGLGSLLQVWEGAQGELSLWEPLQEPQSGSVEQGLSQMDQQDHLVTFDRQIQAEHLAHARCSCGHIK